VPPPGAGPGHHDHRVLDVAQGEAHTGPQHAERLVGRGALPAFARELGQHGKPQHHPRLLGRLEVIARDNPDNDDGDAGNERGQEAEGRVPFGSGARRARGRHGRLDDPHRVDGRRTQFGELGLEALQLEVEDGRVLIDRRVGAELGLDLSDLLLDGGDAGGALGVAVLADIVDERLRVSVGIRRGV